MLKKYFLKVLVTIVTGFVLYGTIPNYDQHESKVAEICQAKGNNGTTLVCPLGYGKKDIAEFDRNSFSVYSAGILSYSTYQEKLSSFGILGNVFLNSSMDEV
tara:strand:+ start:274 stop:579 length:306 start_codon:yes stop_codon:yes gene_type:complete